MKDIKEAIIRYGRECAFTGMVDHDSDLLELALKEVKKAIGVPKKAVRSPKDITS